MCRWSRLSPSLALVLFLLPQRPWLLVQCFSTGAGGCAGGEAAVGGIHLDSASGRPVSNNTLTAGGVVVVMGDTVAQLGTTLSLPTGQNHTITIESIQFPLRGALIRVEAPSGVETAGVLDAGALMQPAVACNNNGSSVVGTTHIDNSDKTILTSTIRFDEAVDAVLIDVTAVFINTIEGSVYTYSRFVVNFVASSSPVAAPSAPTAAGAQTTAPTSVTTTGPLPMPSSAPSVVDAVEPSNSPVASTSVPTTTMPSNEPSSEATTSRPQIEPTATPQTLASTNVVEPPSPAPTAIALSDAPSLVPTAGASTPSELVDTPAPSLSPSTNSIHPSSSHAPSAEKGKGKGKGRDIGKGKGKGKRNSDKMAKGKGKRSMDGRVKKSKDKSSKKDKATKKGHRTKKKKEAESRRMSKDLMKPRKRHKRDAQALPIQP